MIHLGTMFGDIFQSLFKRPATEYYPFERHDTPERLRGQLYYDPTKCSGCQMCTRDCPSEAIELITIDKATKRYVMRYHIDRCTFCAQCVKSCNFNCLGMSAADWELATVDKDPFTIDYGREADLEVLVARAAAGDQPGPGQS
jgi:formate hydrogenlyase subunit 6/NADH:ubiquinone oxidoreductase subunit I